MLNLKEIYESVLVTESKSKHLFQNGDMTFAEIRDILSKVFAGGVMISKKVPGMNVFITYKDGEFCISTDSKDLDSPCCFNKITDKWCKEPEDVKVCFMNTIKDLKDALAQLDPVLLNKYFANGQNYMNCQMSYPPAGCCGNYGNKCFMTFNKLKCFDKDFKEIGEDQDSANELFSALRNNQVLAQEVSEISDENIQKICKCISGKKILDKILAQLQEFINGVGWSCSLNSYIEDKYSRYIINKALEHHLDVSRNSSFVKELVSRLSGTKTKLRPTKSDLITFAKREGIDCHSDDYKQFLIDLENNSEEIGNQIILPIENLIYYAIKSALKHIVSYMQIDPSQKTQKFLSNIDLDTCGINEEDECQFCKDRLEPLKKNLSKINQYVEMLPKDGVVLLFKNSPYKVVSKLGKIDQLCKIIG